MSIEAEMSVLGGAILSQEHARRAVDALTPEMFTHGATAKIFQKIVDLFWESKPIDGVILTSALPEQKVTIVKLAEYIPTLQHYGEYLEIVREAWCRRGLKGGLLSASVSEKGLEEQLKDLEALVGRYNSLLREQREGDVRSFTQAAQELSAWLRSTQRSETVETGFSRFDQATGGLLRKSVCILSARSGRGKTDFALNMALGMGKRGCKVLYFTMEMSVVQLMQRVASHFLGVNGERVRDKRLTEKELAKMDALLGQFEASGKINFVEEPGVSVRRVRHYVELWKPDVVFIDHIGLMERPNQRDAYRALGMVSNQLKQLALEKNIAIVELVQMNRQIENRPGSKPNLSDLRETGDLEQDADYVAFVVPELPEGTVLMGDDSAPAILHLEKNRHGRTGKLEYLWRPQYHRYTEVEARYALPGFVERERALPQEQAR